MVVEESAPGLRMWFWSSTHILGDRCLRYVQAQLEQSTVTSGAPRLRLLGRCRGEVLLLTCPFIEPDIEIRTRSQGTGHAAQVDQEEVDVGRDLLVEDGFPGVEEYPIRALLLGPDCQFCYSAIACGGIATVDDGSNGKLKLRS